MKSKMDGNKMSLFNLLVEESGGNDDKAPKKHKDYSHKKELREVLCRANDFISYAGYILPHLMDRPVQSDEKTEFNQIDLGLEKAIGAFCESSKLDFKSIRENKDYTRFFYHNRDHYLKESFYNRPSDFIAGALIHYLGNFKGIFKDKMENSRSFRYPKEKEHLLLDSFGKIDTKGLNKKRKSEFKLNSIIGRITYMSGFVRGALIEDFPYKKIDRELPYFIRTYCSAKEIKKIEEEAEKAHEKARAHNEKMLNSEERAKSFQMVLR